MEKSVEGLHNAQNIKKIDNMKKIVFKAEKHNWNLSGPNDWHHTAWKIFDDMFVEIRAYYNNDESELRSVITSTIISNKDLKKIYKDVEKAKVYHMHIDAIGGEAWKFEMVGEMTGWKYPLSYIYGRKELEDIGKILEELIVF